MIVVGVFLLAINHSHLVNDHKYWPAALVGGPIAILMGIGALFDPRILVCIGVRDGVVYPTRLKVLAVVLLAAGILIGEALLNWVYPSLI